PHEFQFSVVALFQGMSAALLGALLYLAMASILEMISFWVDNIWSLLVMLRFFVSFFGGAFLPISFFPESFAQIITYTPFYYLIHFPVHCLLGKVTGIDYLQGMLIITAWYAFFQCLSG